MGKKYTQLSLDERYQISTLRQQGNSVRKIATTLDRSASTISRELKRNIISPKNGYQPLLADEIKWSRRWRGSRLERHPELQKYVLDKLVMGLSPEQIAGRMTLENHSMKISHESIYRFVYAQIARYKDYSWRHLLPYGKSKRGHRSKSILGSVSNIPHRISIHQRPQEVLSREEAGNWETDLMMFSDKKSNLMVSIERKSRFVFLNLQSTKQAAPLMKNLAKNLMQIPPELLKSMTFDNGTEFYRHHSLTKKFGMKTFFCDPHKPWQKGSVENMNARLRRYLPRNINLDTITHRDIIALQNKMNHTPRKCLGFKTPYEVLHQVLHFKCESTFLPTQA
jgi:transposase, IS30 family